MSYINPISPINWSHPLNKGLIFDTTILSNTGWSGGKTLQNIAGRGHKANDGVLNNGVVWTKPGLWKPSKFGSIGFDGVDDYIDCGALSGTMNVTGAMSVAFWIRFSTVPAAANSVNVFGVDSYPTGNRGWVCYFNGHNGSDVSVAFFLPANGAASSYCLADSATNSFYLSVGVWYHIECGFLPSIGISIFVNGVNVVSDSTGVGGIPSSSSNPGNPLTIGRRAAGSSPQYFNGYLAGVQIRNRTIGNLEKKLYQEEYTGNKNRFNWIESNVVSKCDTPKLTSSYKTNNNVIVSSTRRPTNSNYVNPSKPINWSNPLNKGLVADWTLLPNPGWANNRIIRDITRGKRSPNDTVSNGSTSTNIKLSGNPRSFYFNGSVFVTTANTTSLSITGGITIAVWFKTTITLGASNWQHICTKGSSASWTTPYCDWLFRLENSTNTGNAQKLTFIVNDGAVLANQVNGTTTVLQDTIYFACATFDGTTMRLYLNGVQDNSKALTASINTSSQGLWIGTRTGGGEYWNGYMNGLQLYNRALSAKEIAQLYQEQRLGRPNTLQWTNSNVGTKFQSSEQVSNATTAGFNIIQKASANYVNPSVPINWSHPLNRGLVGAWNLLGDSKWSRGKKFNDFVRGRKTSHTGTLTGSPTWERGGLKLNGSSQYVDFGNVLDMGTGAFTLVCGVYLTSLPADTAILSKWYDGTNANYRLQITSTGAPFLGINTTSGNQDLTGTTSTITTGVWYDIVGTFDGVNGMNIFVNGINKGSLTCAGTRNSTTANLVLGCLSNNPSNSSFVTGYIKYALIYTRCLPAKEIAQLYQEQRLGRPNTLQWVGNTNNITSSSNQLVNSKYFVKQAINRASTF